MSLNLTNRNHNHTRIVYFVRAQGTNLQGEPVELSLDYWQHMAGTFPYSWLISDYPGHEFDSFEGAYQQAIYAATSYNVGSVDLSTIKVYAVKIETTSKAVNMGVVANG